MGRAPIYNRRVALRARVSSLILLSLLFWGCEQRTLFNYLSDPLPPPVADPAPGSYNEPIAIRFEVAKRDEPVRIFYTTDPTAGYQDRTLWTEFVRAPSTPSLPIQNPASYRAYSYVSDTEFSEIRRFDFVFRPKAPELWPNPGIFTAPTNINLSAGTNTEIHYTTDGSDPRASPALWTGPITLNEAWPQVDPLNPVRRILHIRAVCRSTDPARAAWLDSEEIQAYFAYIPPIPPEMGLRAILPGIGEVALAGQVFSLVEGQDSMVVTSTPTTPPGPFSYSWSLNGTALPIGNVASISIGPGGTPGLDGLEVGIYQVTCSMTDGNGNVYQAAFSFRILPVLASGTAGLVLDLPAQAGVELTGAAVIITRGTGAHAVAATVNPAGSYTYAWYLNGIVTTETNASFGIDSDVLATGAYRLSCEATEIPTGYAHAGSLDFAIVEAPPIPTSGAGNASLLIDLPGNLLPVLSGTMDPVLNQGIDVMTVTAALPGAGYYRWFLNGTPVGDGPSLASLDMGASGPNSPLPIGPYVLSCLVSDGAGHLYSASLAFIVVQGGGGGAPSSAGASLILDLPGGLSPVLGGTDPILTQGSETMTVTALMAGATAYQWYLNGAAVPGATASSIQVGATGPAGSLGIGAYELSCMVRDSGGFSYSAGTGFIVVAPTSPPATGSGAGGLALVLPSSSTSLSVSGSPPSLLRGQAGQTMTVTALLNPLSAPSYRWYLNGASLGATGDTIVIDVSDPGSALAVGDYVISCLVSDLGFDYSASFTFAVLAAPPPGPAPASATLSLSYHLPGNASVTLGGATAYLDNDLSYTISATLAGASAVSYAWYLNGTALPAETASSILLDATHPLDPLLPGNYDLTCFVTDVNGYEYSQSAFFYVVD